DEVALIYVSVREGVSTDRAAREIQALMRERRRISLGEEDDFSVMDMKQIASILSGITAVLTGLLSSVAAVSLVVGGIGIMNIMLVSVTERTREIGIRLAVGAQAGQVLMQFLVEAIVLSLMGGALGIALGLGLAALAGDRITGLCMNDIGPALTRDGLERIFDYVGRNPAGRSYEDVAAGLERTLR
ncbi:FtsX-like permease family protein, partial [Escherichia coli]|nr:FtsX-like permease family protein [Escherichia coli]